MIVAWASLEQISTVLKLTPRMVNRHVRENGMPRIGRGEYDLIACVHWYLDFKDRQIEQARRGDETENQARTRLLRANANLRELELARLRGELITIADAVKTTAEVVSAARSRMLSVPVKAAPVVQGASSPGEAKEILETFVEEALHEIASLPNRLNGLGKLAGDRSPSSLGSGETAAETDGLPMGGRKKTPIKRGLRRAGKVEHRKGRVSKGDHGRRGRSKRGNADGDELGSGGKN